MLFVPQFAHAIGNASLEWTLAQYHECAQNYPYLCEYLAVSDRATAKVKAYFDFDLKFESEDLVPSESQEFGIVKLLFKTLCQAFDPALLDSQIAVASRHRAWTPDNKFKLSNRFYILNGWMTMDELNSCVKKIELPLDCAREDLKNFLRCPLFDISAYSKGRKMNWKMNCLRKSKSVADTRVLLPWTDDLEMEDFLIQYVPDTWPQLTWSNSLLSAPESLSSLSLPSPSTLLLITDSLQVEVIKAGFQQVLSLRPHEIQSLKIYGKTTVVKLDSTYCHGMRRKHSSNRAYLFVTTTAVTQKCHDQDCKENAASMVRTEMDKFPADFRKVAQSILEPGATIALKFEDPM